jgi:hypothetical protein
MAEIAIVAGTLAALALGVSFWDALAADVVLVTGFWLVVGGLAFGLPTGAVYHVALRRSLARVGRLPERWWLHPISHHGLMPREDRAHVLAWCRAGALGCGVVFVGCAVIALGAWRAAAG